MSECAEIQRQIATLFAERLAVEVPSPETDLINAGLLDSLKFVELLLHLEQEFHTQVNFNEVELDNFRSIQKIAEFVARRKA